MPGSLNNIELDAQLLAALYPNVLVQVREGAATSSTTPSKPSALRFLGGNAKRITLLVEDSEHTFLPEDRLSFVMKILQACQLSAGDVAILNTFHEPAWFDRLHELQPETVVSFGLAHPSGPLDFFSPKVVNNILWVAAPPLVELTGDGVQPKGLKTKLWTCLKQVFQIS